MQNTTANLKKENQSMVFDLKGSTLNRITKFPENEQNFWRRELN